MCVFMFIIICHFGSLDIKKVNVLSSLFLTFETNKGNGNIISTIAGLGTGVSPPCKSCKI